MTVRSFPFAGQDSAEDDYYRLHRESGVLSGLNLTLSGLGWSLSPGEAKAGGSTMLVESTPATGSSTATSGSNPRRDMLVARRTLDPDDGSETVLALIQGATAATPVDPTPQRDVVGVFEEPLFSWQVPGGGGGTLTAIRDLRHYIDPLTGLPIPPALHAYRSIDQGIGGGTAAGTVLLNATRAGGSPDLALDPATGLVTVGLRAAGPLDVSGGLSIIQPGPTAGAPGTPLRLYVAVLHNGTEYRGEDKHSRSHVIGDLIGRVMPTVQLNTAVGDTIGFRYYHDSSAAATIASGLGITWMSIRRAV